MPKNFYKLKTDRPGQTPLVYLDLKNHLSFDFFVDADIDAFIEEELLFEDTPYAQVLCYVPDGDIPKLDSMMEKLSSEIVGQGYSDYPKECRIWHSFMENNDTDTKVDNIINLVERLKKK